MRLHMAVAATLLAVVAGRAETARVAVDRGGWNNLTNYIGNLERILYPDKPGLVTRMSWAVTDLPDSPALPVTAASEPGLGYSRVTTFTNGLWPTNLLALWPGNSAMVGGIVGDEIKYRTPVPMTMWEVPVRTDPEGTEWCLIVWVMQEGQWHLRYLGRAAMPSGSQVTQVIQAEFSVVEEDLRLTNSPEGKVWAIAGATWTNLARRAYVKTGTNGVTGCVTPGIPQLGGGPGDTNMFMLAPGAGSGSGADRVRIGPGLTNTPEPDSGVAGSLWQMDDNKAPRLLPARINQPEYYFFEQEPAPLVPPLGLPLVVLGTNVVHSGLVTITPGQAWVYQLQTNFSLGLRNGTNQLELLTIPLK